MKKPFLLTVVITFALLVAALTNYSRAYQQEAGYILEHENAIAKDEPAPHNGTGSTTAYSFFSKATDLHMAFRKRVLHKGASIGYHLQEEDEIYYVLSGRGEMKMNNKTFAVKQGDAILTRPGSSHGLQQKGDEDLVVIITYQTK